MLPRIARILAAVVVPLALPCALLALVTPVAAADYFLHSGATDTLDQTAPTGTTATFKDSPAVSRTTYQPIGAWAATPIGSALRLESLSNLHVWVGLKNSDDQGTYFDVRAEIRRNGAVIASGETKNIQGVVKEELDQLSQDRPDVKRLQRQLRQRLDDWQVR